VSAPPKIDLQQLQDLPARCARLETEVAELRALVAAGPPLDPDALLTPQEAAAELHVSRDAIYKMIRRGKLVAHQVADTRSVRVRRGDLLRGV
jgi:excisionase family DNA binding protein